MRHKPCYVLMNRVGDLEQNNIKLNKVKIIERTEVTYRNLVAKFIYHHRSE